MVTYYRGQRISQERGKFWVYCLARPFRSRRSAERWIDRNICPTCLQAKTACAC